MDMLEEAGSTRSQPLSTVALSPSSALSEGRAGRLCHLTLVSPSTWPGFQSRPVSRGNGHLHEVSTCFPNYGNIMQRHMSYLKGTEAVTHQDTNNQGVREPEQLSLSLGSEVKIPRRGDPQLSLTDVFTLHTKAHTDQGGIFRRPASEAQQPRLPTIQPPAPASCPLYCLRGKLGPAFTPYCPLLSHLNYTLASQLGFFPLVNPLSTPPQPEAAFSAANLINLLQAMQSFFIILRIKPHFFTWLPGLLRSGLPLALNFSRQDGVRVLLCLWLLQGLPLWLISPVSSEQTPSFPLGLSLERTSGGSLPHALLSSGRRSG